MAAKDSIFGEPAFHSGSPHHRRIVGIIKSKQINDYVTLEDCHFVNSSTSIDPELSSSTFGATHAFVGVAYGADCDITLSELRFSTSALDEWLNISGAGVSHKLGKNNRIDSITIQYSTPEKRQYSLPNNMTLEINFDSTVPLGPNAVETKISQRARISLRATEHRPVGEFFDLALKIQNLLCFCIDEILPPDFVVGYSDEVVQPFSGEKTHKIPIRIFYRSTLGTEPDSSISRRNMLLTYALLEPRFEDVLRRWLVAYDKYKPTFDLFFGMRVGAYKYIEAEFLSMIQAIESLHRRRNHSQRLPKEQFDNIVAAMLRTVPTEYQDFFDNKLRYSNEPTLKKRVAAMFEPYWSLYQSTESKGELVRKIVDTRNYLTHYSSDLNTRACKGVELFHLSKRMEALLQLHVLEILGLERSTIEDIVADDRQLLWKLGATE